MAYRFHHAGLLLLLGLAGCASQGPLRPPSLHLPDAVRGLSAERFGDHVDLSWTAPTRTSDGISLAGKHGAGVLTVEICRETKPLKPTDPCSPITRLPAEAGAEAAFSDVLPPALSAGPPRALFYRLRVVNHEGKGASWSEIPAAAGEAPPPVRNLRAEAVSDGVALRWEPDGTAGASAARKTLIRVKRGSKSQLLTVENGSGAAPDGGALDAGAHRGVAQVYRVFRNEAATDGTLALTLNSEPAVAMVAAAARPAAPPPPAGVEAVVNSLGAPEIDLVWQADSTGAAKGYAIYRAEGDARPTLLTPEPVRGFSYADKQVRPGVAYSYRIASMGEGDVAGSQGPAVTATVPMP